MAEMLDQQVYRRQSIDLPDPSSIIEDVASATVEETTRSAEQSTLPLTTIFTPGEGCIGNDVFTTTTQSNTVWCEMDPNAMKRSCYPSSYKAYQYELADVYYSPGICPQSYVYVSTSVSTHKNTPNTTYATCCPYNLAHLSEPLMMCRTTLPLGTGLPTILNANSILVAWQESDLSLFSPLSEARAVLESAGVSIPPDFVSPRTNTDKSASSTFKTQTAPTTKTDGGDPGNAGGGLSTGAAAGIGVTVGLIGVMATVAMWWFIKRYRSKRSCSNVEESRQPWLQQMYKVTDTTTKLDEGVETPKTGLRG